MCVKTISAKCLAGKLKLLSEPNGPMAGTKAWRKLAATDNSCLPAANSCQVSSYSSTAVCLVFFIESVHIEVCSHRTCFPFLVLEPLE